MYFDESELTGNNMNHQDECALMNWNLGRILIRHTTVTIMKVEHPSLANVDILGLNSTSNGVAAASNIQQILANAKTTAGIAEAAHQLVNDAKKQTAERLKAEKMAAADFIKEKKKALALEKKAATLKNKQKKIEEKEAAQLLKVTKGKKRTK
jgi:hypothetical protein